MLPFIQSSYLTTLLECFSAGVVIMNGRGDVYAANDMAGRMLGVAHDDLLKAGFERDILPRFEERSSVARLMSLARDQDAHPEPVQARCSHPELGMRHYTLSISRLVEYGKVFGIVLQMADVTHIYEMHEREKRMLEERSESLAHLSMAIAHQIRNPLMTIGGFASLLPRKIDQGQPVTQFIQGIQDGARRLEDIVRAVTQYTSPRQHARRATDLRALAKEALDRLGPLPGRVAVETGTPDEAIPTWFLDPELTRDSLVEILQNSLDALAQTGGTIRVGWREESADLLLEVRDDGPGIAPECLPFLFDPFFTTKAVGVGMGLAKARRWSREQAGELNICNSPEGGTLAVLRLPGVCVLKNGTK